MPGGITIRTRYQGPRGLRGSVIIARGAGRQATVPYDPARRSVENHRHAAEILAARLCLTLGDGAENDTGLRAEWRASFGGGAA